MKKILIFNLLPLLFLISCATEDIERSKALINVYLIDSPGDFGQLWVELLGVEVQVTGTRGLDNANPVFLNYTAADKEVNLSALISGNQLLVGRSEFLLGTVISLTLKLGTNNYIVQNGNRIPVTFDNQQSASPTVEVNFPLQAGISHDIYLDFNIYRSVRKVENITEIYVLNPKITAFNKAETGEIEGNVRPQGLNAVIYAIQESDTLATGVDTERGGAFLVQGVVGDYSIIIQPFGEDYASDTLRAVTVEQGKVTRLGNITLQRK